MIICITYRLKEEHALYHRKWWGNLGEDKYKQNLDIKDFISLFLMPQLLE